MDWEVVVTQVMVMMGQVEKVIVGVRRSETDVFYRLFKMVVIGYFLMFYKQHLNTIYRKIIISFSMITSLIFYITLLKRN